MGVVRRGGNADNSMPNYPPSWVLLCANYSPERVWPVYRDLLAYR